MLCLIFRSFGRLLRGPLILADRLSPVLFSLFTPNFMKLIDEVIHCISVCYPEMIHLPHFHLVFLEFLILFGLALHLPLRRNIVVSDYWNYIIFELHFIIRWIVLLVSFLLFDFFGAMVLFNEMLETQFIHLSTTCTDLLVVGDGLFQNIDEFDD